MNAKNMIVFFLGLGLSLVSGIAQDIPLEKTKMQFVIENPEGYFKTVTDMKISEDHLFCVDNMLNRVLDYEIKGNQLIYRRTIGRPGQGPGELNRPSEISISGNTIAVKETGGVTLYEKTSGKYLGKIRLFTGNISILLIQDRLYSLCANPTSRNLIEVFDFQGKMVNSFGEKYYPADLKLYNELGPVFAETTLYDGLLLGDGEDLNYYNKKFGKVIYWTNAGTPKFSADISGCFGDVGTKLVEDYIDLFLKGGFKISKGQPGIPSNPLYREGRIIDDKVYFLDGQFNPLKRRMTADISITRFNKEDMKREGRYLSKIEDGDIVRDMEVQKESGKIGFFIALYDSVEGFAIYKLSVDAARHEQHH